MKLKVILGGVKRTLTQFQSEEEFINSPYYLSGYRIEREPSQSVKEIVKENSKKEIQEEPIIDEPIIEETIQEDEIESLRAEYESTTGKKISKKYANNIEWMTSKINEYK